jgi:glycosyltransferase involved in cell wall biosynthesis
MPRSLLEACSMGKPIISVMTPGCREVIRDNYNGLVAEVRNIESLAKAMLKFIELPYEAKLQLGVNGRQMVAEHFEQADICSQYMKIVNQILKK